MLLSGSVVLVTGASRGIGAAAARLLAERGARVVCTGRDASALRATVEPFGGTAVVADLAEPGGASSAVEQAVSACGRLDGLVANAGVGYAGDFAAMPPERVSYLVEVNLKAPMLLARASVEAIRSSRGGEERRGAGMVFVSSIAGAVGVPAESVYSATKAGLDAFACLLREELRRDGISVGVVAPGVVDTDFFASRGAPYTRRFPRPMPVERAAQVVVRALERGTERTVEPRWLAVPAWLSAALPGIYRPLARRFG